MSTGNPANQDGGEWATEPVALAAGLLHAVTPEEVARLLLQDQAIAAHRGCVMWSTRWPREISAWPPEVMEGPRIAAAMDAVAAIRTGSPAPAGFHVLHDGGDEVAVLHGPASLRGAPDDVRARFREVLAMQRIQETVARLQDAEKLQRSLYAIADMAGSDLEMTEMLHGLHRIVADLMYAENFYIAQYDRNRDSLRFLYFADVVDTEGPSPDEEVPLARIERGLTWYLTRDRRPLMGNTEQLRAQVSGELRLHGADSSDWLGVPMLRDGEVVGAVVVQSYRGRQAYTPAEMSLLAFVAEHILTALERKRGQAELERRVVERTLQLEDANSALRHQVAERERGERLQAALYRIAALAGGEETSERFYRHVHAIVGELLDARNFYIALRSEDGQAVTFPYARDAHEKDWCARSCGRGLTEYVLRTGRPQLVDMARAEALLASGEISAGMMGSPTRVWLGAPLLGTDGPIGVVAVQSYESEDCYTERDAELLTFVSYQIASSLQRRRAAVLLKRANTELERRVEERTRELREQIAVREQVEAQLQHQVMHDTLTTLPNRAYLRDRLERALKRVQRDPSQGFGLLYIDVDRFKLVNDSLGHRSGDAVLKQVALRLAACVRDPDVVARLAGDEFVILLEHVPLPETASKVAQRVLRMLQAPLQLDDRELQVSVSIGIAIVDQRYDSADRVLHDADVALYRAKGAGRNRFVLFDDAMHHNAMGVLDMEQALRDGLVRDEFVPHFQPLVRLADRSVVGFEALLRWQHPQRGLLAPPDFLKVAEDSGLMEQIDWRMYRRAMEAGRALVGPECFLTLNVSPKLLKHADFDRRLLALAEEVEFDPSRLRLEVTEGALLEDPEAVQAMLQRLREARIEAALDDFGTGYSSLGHVHQFPLRMIKIDRSFVAPLADGMASRSGAVIGAILALGHALGIEIVAEGIETECQCEALVALGCAYGQGYLFAHPHPARHWAEPAG